MGFINKRKKGKIKDGASEIEERLLKYEKSKYIKKHENSEVVMKLIEVAKEMYNLPSFKNNAIELLDIVDKIDKPLLVMIMGEFKTGKTTFINGILGEEILKSDVTPATAVVSMISYGKSKKIKAHLSNGTISEFPYDKLHTLTAEGDEDAANLRSEIKYVEIFLPKKILKRITIIDTPGLNVDNKVHINATKSFMKEADYVYWVFAYGKVASKTEIAAIRELSHGIKPVAIVNRIDEIDEEEESIEEALDEIRKRIKDNITDIVGVSSLLAQKAIKTRDKNLLKESNWTEFEKKMNTELIENSDKLKDNMVEIKIESYIKNIEEIINNRSKVINNIKDKITNSDRYKNRLIGELEKLELYVRASRNLEKQDKMKTNGIDKYTSDDELVDIDKSVRSKIAAASGFKRVLNKLENTQRIIENIDSFDIALEEIYHEIDLIEEDSANLIERQNLLGKKIKQHNNDMDKYKNSGFFGGAPIFDWHGKGERLNKNAEKLNSERNNIDTEYINNCRKKETFISRIKSINNQIINYSGQTIKPIMEKKYKELFNELETFDQDCRKNKIIIGEIEEESYKVSNLKFKLEEIPRS